ncbi:hypothetical protein BC939DRAFT_529919 [Gamsiella multidivaricata]|uniref:uncharacterized protein n=1 Tax=Gamsiella multidivaricata TaxID=101098 RepID=UPI00221F2983|nr:uncharacterized protein BC939DRAFT_529919 [Gamsiella multidivaricata]KAI7821742.1 hypothetical protein BC939DRAFT_529919 [Gamsiella multidivaricata]
MSSGPDPSKGLWNRPSTEMALSLRQHTGGSMVGKRLLTHGRRSGDVSARSGLVMLPSWAARGRERVDRSRILVLVPSSAVVLALPVAWSLPFSASPPAREGIIDYKTYE